jgi:hypothetical protein
MPDLDVKIYKSFGGRSNRGQWSNHYLIRTTHALNSAELLTDITALVHFEEFFHLDQVNFMRAVVSTPAHEGRAGHPEAFRSIELSNVGLRATAGGAAATIALDVCLAVKKAGTLGRAGQELYRGCLLETDVSASGAGDFLLTNGFAPFDQASTDYFAHPDYPKILINSDKTGNTAGARIITSMKIGGVIVKKKVNRRKHATAKSTSSAGNLLAQALPLAAGALAYYLTKSPGAFTAVEKATAVASATSVGDILGRVIEHLTTPTI